MPPYGGWPTPTQGQLTDEAVVLRVRSILATLIHRNDPHYGADKGFTLRENCLTYLENGTFTWMVVQTLDPLIYNIVFKRLHSDSSPEDPYPTKYYSTTYRYNEHSDTLDWLGSDFICEDYDGRYTGWSFGTG